MSEYLHLDKLEVFKKNKGHRSSVIFFGGQLDFVNITLIDY